MASTALVQSQGLLSCGLKSNLTQQSTNGQACKLAIPSGFTGLRNGGVVSKVADSFTGHSSVAHKKAKSARRGLLNIQATAAGAVGTAEKQVTEQATVRIGTRGRCVYSLQDIRSAAKMW
jgi:hypothetical protein